MGWNASSRREGHGSRLQPADCRGQASAARLVTFHPPRPKGPPLVSVGTVKSLSFFVLTQWGMCPFLLGWAQASDTVMF